MLNANDQTKGLMIRVRERVARTRDGSVRVLRAMAGLSAGVRGDRRGTFMVVVIGTLALLAVIAIAHFAVGQADRRASASLARSDRLADVPQLFAQYVTDVMAQDLFLRTPEEVNAFIPNVNRRLFRREAFDIPSTDWRSLSTVTEQQVASGARSPFEFFSPAGLNCDPWLASTEPTFLNYNPANDTQIVNDHTRNRDWAQISSISPDGRFVNLAALRNNFGAESGLGSDSRNRPRLSRDISLLRYNMDQTRANNTLGWQRVGSTDFGLQTTNGGLVGRPATFGTRQVGMFGPMRGKLPNAINPGSTDYPDYQLADTDGDGFADARWIELVDARDPNNIQSFLPNDDKVRWFFATRIIDLSGLVNVNTATDLRYAATAASPVGLTPADIDLKRLLTMQDVYANLVAGGQPQGYDSILQPQALNLDGGTTRADNYFTGQNGTRYDTTTARDVGNAAYAALRDSFDKKRVPLGTTAFINNANNYEWDIAPNQPEDSRGILRTIDWREFARSSEGMNYFGTTYTAQTVFGIEDLAELLTRHGQNDPLRTSRLESTLDGRFFTNAQTDSKRRFGPLRSNRSADVEQTVIDGAGNIFAQTWLMRAADVRSKLTTISLSRPIRNLAGQLTGDITIQPSNTSFLDGRDNRLSATDGMHKNSPIGVSTFFGGYVRALAPAMAMPGVWPNQVNGAAYGGNDFEQRRTLFYGHNGPELALLSAGTMAVNAAAMISDPSPLPHVLVLEQQLAQRLWNENHPRIFGTIPAFASFATQGLCLDIQDTANPVLAVGGTDFVQAPAVNIYSITEQPVITGVGLLSAWVDSPLRLGNSRWKGDNDSEPPRVGGGDPARQVTLNGDVAETNPDFLARALVIQLHNPFDKPVTTMAARAGRAASTQVDDLDQFYYVRQLDSTEAKTSRAYLLAQLTRNGNTYEISGITIGPGETVACVVYSDIPLNIAEHMSYADLSGVSVAECENFVMQDWIKHQFAEDEVDRVVVIPRIEVPQATVDDADRTQADQIKNASFAFDELISRDEAGTVFQLVEAVRQDMSTIGGPNELPNAGTTPRNDPANDRVRDRFRMPRSESLDRRILEGNNPIPGTFGGPQLPERSTVSPRTDNSSILVTRWAYAVRPSDPTPANIESGSIPAYCIEPKVSAADWNQFEEDDAATGVWTIDSGEIDGNPTIAFWSVKEYREQQGANDSPLMEYLAVGPAVRAGNDIPSNRYGESYDDIRGPMVTSAKFDRGFGEESTRFTTSTPDTRTGRVPLLRATDLLLPMALAPMEAPVGPGPAYDFQRDPSKRWTTLGECLAIAYGYEEIPTVDGGSNNTVSKQNLRSVYVPVPAMPGASRWGPSVDRFSLDRGQLVIDDFAPFFDNNRDRFFSAQDNDLRFGIGIPCALNVLDVFSTIDPEYGSLSRPASGQVNINTAPAAVLRTLPLLTPPDDSAWGTELIWAGAPTDITMDLAASLEGYRDKRPLEPWQSQPATRRRVDAGANKVRFLDQDRNQTQGNVTPNNSTRLVGRARETQIVGIREELGFASLGELLCVIQGRDRSAFSAPSGSSMASRDRRGNMDTLGWDGATSNALGVTSLLRPDSPGSNTPVGYELDSGSKDTYEQRLQIAAGLMNTTTVRSDVFACWFVVRGYTRNDCENLGATDPLVPSIERRFLMVVDRSNVSQYGQQPKILLMQELPVVK